MHMCKYIAPERDKNVFNTVVYYIGEGLEGLGWPSRFKEVPTIHEAMSTPHEPVPKRARLDSKAHSACTAVVVKNLLCQIC